MMNAVCVDQFLIGDMKNFVYLLTHEGESLVIDPQADLSPWENRMSDLHSKLKGVLLTHSHTDHIAGVPLVCEKYAVPIHVHEADAHRIQKKFARVVDEPHVVRLLKFVKEGDRVQFGGKHVEVMHTPGHSAGECCYRLDASLFTGDTVFVGTVGRTDLETGSDEDLFATLERLKKMPDETLLYPGHDYGKTRTSTIGREKRESAAFGCRTVEALKAIP